MSSDMLPEGVVHFRVSFDMFPQFPVVAIQRFDYLGVEAAIDRC